MLKPMLVPNFVFIDAHQVIHVSEGFPVIRFGKSYGAVASQNLLNLPLGEML